MAAQLWFSMTMRKTLSRRVKSVTAAAGVGLGTDPADATEGDPGVPSGLVALVEARSAAWSLAIAEGEFGVALIAADALGLEALFDGITVDVAAVGELAWLIGADAQLTSTSVRPHSPSRQLLPWPTALCAPGPHERWDLAPVSSARM